MKQLFVDYKLWFKNESNEGRKVQAIEESLFVVILIDLVMILMVLGFFTDVNMNIAINTALMWIGLWKLVWSFIRLWYKTYR